MSQSTGLLWSLKRLSGTLLAIIHARLELLSVELEEQRLGVKQMLLYASIALFCFGMAVMLLTVFVIALFWDSYRLQVVGGLSALFFVAGIWTWIALRRLAREKSKLFSSSLGQLADDIERLTPKS